MKQRKKNKAAVSLGKKGSVARNKKLTAEQRTAIAKKAAAARWKNLKTPEKT